MDKCLQQTCHSVQNRLNCRHQIAGSRSLRAAAPQRVHHAKRICYAGMGLGFTGGLILPRSSEPKLEVSTNSYGLSTRQMAALGLTEDSIAKPLEANEVQNFCLNSCSAASAEHALSPFTDVQESITAKACYSSDKVHENTRVTTTMCAGTGAATGQAPPDLPSLLLDGRICYIGMPVSIINWSCKSPAWSGSYAQHAACMWSKCKHGASWFTGTPCA